MDLEVRMGGARPLPPGELGGELGLGWEAARRLMLPMGPGVRRHRAAGALCSMEGGGGGVGITLSSEEEPASWKGEI